MKTIRFEKRFGSSATFLVRNVSLILTGLLLAGCPANKQEGGMPASADSNKLVIRGSNTIGEELAPKLIAEFKKDHPSTVFDVESKATGYGLAMLRAGQCDIAEASRQPNMQEIQDAVNSAVRMNDYRIGFYSVAVVLHPGNTVTNLSREQVRNIFTGTIKNWQEVGGPNLPIHVCVRDPISGTYLGFKELALENKAYAPDVKLFTNYESIVQSVAQDPGSIGYAGVELPKDAAVKTALIDGIAANPSTVSEGKYPYARGLHFYTRTGNESTAARDFIQFVQSSRGKEILAQLGFVPPS